MVIPKSSGSHPPPEREGLIMILLRFPLVTAAALIALVHPAAAQGRKVADLLREVSARAHARTQGVQNYTVHTTTVGSSVVSYVSRGPDGNFQVQLGGNRSLAGPIAEMSGWGDGLLHLVESGMADDEDEQELEEMSRYEGVVISGGVPAHRISANVPADSMDDMPMRLSVDFDTATLLTRRLEAEMPTRAGTPGRAVIELSDWRPVGTIMLPYRRRMVIRGMRGELMGADTADAEQTLAQGRALLPSLPKEQREAARQMLVLMEGLFRRDEMVLDEIVTSVTVNQGPPRGISLGPPQKH